MRKITLTLVALLCGAAAYGAQDSGITVREVRNPNTLATYLNANAADAESRLTSGSSSAATLDLINTADTGTAYLTLQADQAADAGDKYGVVASDGAGLLIQSDKDSKGTMATKLTVGNTGILTMKGGATLDNTTSATVLTITETTTALAGILTVSGAATVTGTLTGSGVGAVGSLTCATNATVGGTLAVTGVGTFTAESVHNLGVDADYITVDGGAGGGVDTKTGLALNIGESTATLLNLGATDITTYNLGALTSTGLVTAVAGIDSTSDIILENDEIIRNDVDNAVEFIFNDDSATLGSLVLDTSIAVANQADGDTYNISARGVDTATNATVYATIQMIMTDNTSATENGQIVLQTCADGSGITGLTIGHNAAGTHACTIVPDTTITGDLTVSGGDIDGGAAALNIGKAAATSLVLGASDINTSVAGPLIAPRVYAAVSGTSTNFALTSANYGEILVVTNVLADITLPANGAAIGSWIDVAIGAQAGAADNSCVVTVSAATTDTLIGPNDVDLKSVTWATANRINAYAKFWSDGSFWHVQNLGGTTMTYTD